jgi:putative molybdopterin biosynthesis protein
VRLAVGRVGGELSGAPLGRGAGMITTLTRAQAVLRIPENLEGREAGEVVEVDLLGAPSDVERVLMHVGSHDNTLDRIADRLMGLETPLVLVSAHVGSMGGLAALAQGTALFAGCHLFDPATGDFNFPFLERHLPGVDVTVINLAIRHQGLIVAPSNPKSIRGVADLARADVRFVNRQRGAGTRILLDHHLALAHIDPSAVRGYGDEEVTHMGVAVNVKTGAADCGLGILSAAAALELGFVPMARERYDLIIPAAALADARVAALLGIVRSPDFQAEIRAMGGYETTLTGRVMAPGMGLADG